MTFQRFKLNSDCKIIELSHRALLCIVGIPGMINLLINLYTIILVFFAQEYYLSYIYILWRIYAMQEL
jgi:hypothetical protein